jgi:hypothetical protein
VRGVGGERGDLLEQARFEDRELRRVHPDGGRRPRRIEV